MTWKPQATTTYHPTCTGTGPDEPCNRPVTPKDYYAGRLQETKLFRCKRCHELLLNRETRNTEYALHKSTPE